MAMDVKRDPKILKRKKIRNWTLLGVAIVAIAAASVAVSRLKPAAPTVDSVPWCGVVTRGSMVRDVRGSGTLVPEDIRWIPSVTSGRVVEIPLHPGDKVEPNTVILVLENPDLEQTVQAAELALKASEAALATRQADLRTQLLQDQASVATAESNVKNAQAQFEAYDALAKDKLISDLDLQRYRSQLDQAKTALDLATQSLKIAQEGQANLIAPQQADVNQKRADYDLKRQQLEDLRVKAGMSGVVQVIPVERGQQVGPGTNLARVANPNVLKAQIRISETQTKDLRPGQLVDIDTHSGHVRGHVERIDPAAQTGTVGVDVTLEDKLPPGARPDLSVDGVVQLERLDNVVKVSRPAFGTEFQTISLFRLTPDGHEATRTQVKIGRASVNEVEILDGLKPGDQVILSDMSNYDAFDRVRCTCGSNGG